MELQATPKDHAPFMAQLPLQEHKVVLVVDLVESVLLMAANEAAVVQHWQGFTAFADKQVSAHRGRVVKSLGDGLLAEFDESADAVRAAMDLQTYFAPINRRLPPDQHMHLRAGINASQLYVSAYDVYGQGVNLAARVTSLANPGDIVVTASVRDGIVDGIDGEIEDMGESFLKHWPEPVRTWRVHPVRASQSTYRPEPREAALTDFRPSIAVIPFESRHASPEDFVIGELIADGVIAQLSRSQDLRVISRLSTTAFRGRSASPKDIDGRLDAAFVLSGSYAARGDKVIVMAELSDTRRNEVVWADRLGGDTMDLMEIDSEILNTLSATCAHALLQSVVQRSLALPLPKLDSHALMHGGIALMHRSTARDLDRSRELLLGVTDRHPRVAAPWAWLAKWHVMQVVQGRAADPRTEFARAIDLAEKALARDASSSMALAIKGHAMCHLGHDVQGARNLLLDAVQVNPNDPMAWLYAGFWSSMWGDPNQAVEESERAFRLSPMDPHRFYFQMQLANSYLAKNEFEKAATLCKQSLKSNSLHLSTLRTLICAEHELGSHADAQRHFQLLRQHQPSLTLKTYLETGSDSLGKQRVAKALVALGLPVG
jgi:class 3 adenylate cyclase/tetratricopeptide (TPR) repeat protein